MRFIPNEEAWVGFAATLTGTLQSPKAADINGAVDLTKTVQGLTATSTGQSVATPAFDSKWNGSIPGTIDGTFSLDAYRFTTHPEDLAWLTLPRETVGTIFIARHGGKPAVADDVESWPIAVTSRSVPQMTSNTPVGCTVTASVPSEPAEDAVVVT